MGIYSLETLPPDIWAYVAFFLHGEHLGRLKLTGSKSLWQRLRCTNVVKTIKLGKDLLQLKSWPAFLNELPSIEQLYINCRSNKWWSNLGLKLSMVPPTLRKLQITGRLFCIDDFFVGDRRTTLYLDKYVPYLEYLDLPDVMIENTNWMTRWPKSLTSLTVLSWEAAIPFPDSLIHLKIWSDVIITPSSPQKLPPRLESLFSLESDTSSLVPPLKSFRSFKLPHFDVARPNEMIESLPRTLTEFTFPHFPAIPSSTWPYLPPGLEILSLETDLATCAVPRKIIDPITKESFPTVSFPLESLPRSITHLHINSAENSLLIPPPDKLSYFPPRLTTLSATGLQLSVEAAKGLPASLTHLSIVQLCERVCEHLPRGLTNLRAFDAIVSQNLIKFLPQRLHSLFIRAPTKLKFAFDPDTGKFPYSSKLGQDENDVTKFTWQGELSLPTTLTSITLGLFQGIQDSFAHQKFPNLMVLEMPGSTELTDLAIPHLNQYLTRLELPDASKITGKCFPHLCRHLVHLNLDASSSIFDPDIPHLPQTLRYVHFRSAIHLTDRCIRDFPRQLEILQMRNNELLTQNCYSDLPYPIKSYRHKLSFEAAKC